MARPSKTSAAEATVSPAGRCRSCDKEGNLIGSKPRTVMLCSYEHSLCILRATLRKGGAYVKRAYLALGPYSDSLRDVSAPRQTGVLAGLVIDPHDQIPAHVQIKNHLKFARTCQELTPGDVLPSIRGLARQLSVGDGVVRRAYRELREIGLLVTENRKHVIVAPGLSAGSNTDGVRASIAQCDELIAWADKNRLSAIALGRLLLRRALTREAALPSYLFVDICRRAAEESVVKLSKLWAIKVAGVSVGDFTKFGSGNPRHFSAVLVNEYLYGDVIAVAGEIKPRVFSVRMRLDERVRRRIGRLPRRSTVLLVCSDDDFSRTGRAMLQHCKHAFGSKWRFQAKKVSEIPDLTRLIRAQQYRLFLFTPLVWETLPGRIKRMVRVAPAFSEPEPQSLEEIRIAAGVLL